jgi:hypothetical protein
MTIGKTLSVIVAAAYLIAAFTFATPAIGPRVLAFLILPMACIWFSEELGEFTGDWGGHHIDQKSPGCMIAFLGWVLLLLPPFAIFITHLIAGR